MKIVVEIPEGRLADVARLYFESHRRRRPEDVVFEALEDKLVAWARTRLRSGSEADTGRAPAFEALAGDADETADAIAERVRAADLARGYAAIDNSGLCACGEVTA